MYVIKHFHPLQDIGLLKPHLCVDDIIKIDIHVSRNNLI